MRFPARLLFGSCSAPVRILFGSCLAPVCRSRRDSGSSRTCCSSEPWPRLLHGCPEACPEAGTSPSRFSMFRCAQFPLNSWQSLRSSSPHAVQRPQRPKGAFFLFPLGACFLLPFGAFLLLPCGVFFLLPFGVCVFCFLRHLHLP